MNNKTFNGDKSSLASAPLYFDCATIMEERGVVYNDLTPENLSKWFKDTKFKFPVRVMGENDFRAVLKKDQDGEKVLVVYRWNWVDDVVSDKWTIRVGNRLTASKWFGITRFIQDYLTGYLQERNGWNESKTLRLA